MIRALVLSGGGGRGGFHAGVYKYLMEADKKGVNSDHKGIWDPDVVVGTSIGAFNGAAIVQGIPPDELVDIWLSLTEEDIAGIPPAMGPLARAITRRAFQSILKAKLPIVPKAESTSVPPNHFWPPLPLMPNWLGERLIGRWANLLDTGPWKRTLLEKFHFDPEKVAASSKALLIAATKVQTGERVMFSNRPVLRRETGKARPDIVPGITLKRILASASIPLVYPWTYDQETDAYYWDGAVVANTPIGSALDAAGDQPADVPAEIVVVMMTPWWESGETPPDRASELPQSFGEAITWTLDWVLLASFRERLRLIDAYNQFARQEREIGSGPFKYRDVKVIIVAPVQFSLATRIIDYDYDESKKLIEDGYEAAKKAFKNEFPG